MARLSALLAVASAAVAIGAKPVVVRDSPVTLPIARRFNLTGAANILKSDQARAKVLKARSQASKESPVSSAAVSKLFARDVDVAVTNGAVIYTASVGVGTPPTSYDLIIDTGSSNMWVGAGKAYVETSSSVDTGDEAVSLSRLISCGSVASSRGRVGLPGSHLRLGPLLRGGVHRYGYHRGPRHREPGRWSG